MATITKRQWETAKGEPRSAWVLAFTDREGKRHKKQFAKKRDAEREQARVTAEISKGSWRAEAERKTVKDAVDGYASELETLHADGHVATGYYRNTKSQLENYVLPKLGSTVLADLTKGRVVELRDTMRDDGVGRPTINRTLGAFSRALKHASERDWISGNPASGVTLKARREDNDKRVHAPSRAVLAKLLAAADDELAARVRFAIATGLRASEQWALRWGDISIKKKTLTVCRTVDIYGTVREATKSEAGKRNVPLSDAMVAMLEARQGAKDDFVFPDSQGGFTRHTNFTRRVWNPLFKDTELEPIGWHSLRHFAISSWVASGMNLKAVQVIAGHSTFQMTVDRYSHLLPEDVPHQAFNDIAATLP